MRPIYLLFLLLLYSCQRTEIVPEIYQPCSAHEAYLHSLKQANLDQTALGKDWIHVAEECLKNPLSITPPHQEIFHFDHTAANAMAYQIDAFRGQKLLIDFSVIDSSEITLFIDLFRIENDSLNEWEHIASADSSSCMLSFEVLQDATYLLRIQSELLRGANLQMVVQKVPSLAFPVANGENRDIGSFFGDPRDGGRREHHGIDIFARRHTPIISPIKGRVRFAGEKGLGGRVVWLRNTHQRQTLYFAHLQDIFVSTGDEIGIGDTLGTVGNTGNARTTPPHLHFGIYSRGPIDPYPFVAHTKTSLSTILGDQNLLGRMARTKSRVALPENELLSLEKYQLLTVNAMFENLCRVTMPNGQQTLLRQNMIEAIDEPIKNEIANSSYTFIPNRESQVATPLSEQDSISFLGKDEHLWFVKKHSGTAGWLMMP